MYKMDESIPSFRGYFIFHIFFTEIYVSKHSVDPDQMLHLAASDMSLHCLYHTAKWVSGPGCPKLMTSLVNVSLKFRTLISEICHYFLLKKCEKLLQGKSFSYSFNKKYQ